MQSST